jgi:hypothetical protein
MFGPAVDTLSMSNAERNMTYRMIGEVIRARGATYCFEHGVVDGGCSSTCHYPDLSRYVFGGLHKKDVLGDG